MFGSPISSLMRNIAKNSPKAKRRKILLAVLYQLGELNSRGNMDQLNFIMRLFS
jgi:hypothetical protein